MVYEVVFKPRGIMGVVVEADSKNEAVALAWKELEEESPSPEWDVETVEVIPTEEEG